MRKAILSLLVTLLLVQISSPVLASSPASIDIGQNGSSPNNYGFFSQACAKTFTVQVSNGVRVFFQNIQSNPPDNWAPSQTIVYSGGNPFGSLIFDYNQAGLGTFDVTVRVTSPVWATVTRTFDL